MEDFKLPPVQVETSSSPLTFVLLSQETVLEVDFKSRTIHGATSMEIVLSSKELIPLLNFHIGFLGTYLLGFTIEIRHIILNGMTMTTFIDERPNHLNQAQQINEFVASGAKFGAEVSLASSSVMSSNWKCPTMAKDFFHGGINAKHSARGSRPGPPLFGSLYLHLSPEILSVLPDDLRKVSLEIHFSLSCNRKNRKVPFYPIDKDIPLFGHRGAFFYWNDVYSQDGRDISESKIHVDVESSSKLCFIAGPCASAGYFGATIPSAQVFMPIMGLHLNVPDPSMSYIAAPRTVAQWKLSVAISEDWISSIGDKFNVIGPALALPCQVSDHQIFEHAIRTFLGKGSFPLWMSKTPSYPGLFAWWRGHFIIAMSHRPCHLLHRPPALLDQIYPTLGHHQIQMP